MDMFVPSYMDLFEFQEKSKEMYRSIMDDLATLDHHCNVLNTLKEFGYSKPLIDAVGGESFTTSIHISKSELEGRDLISKKSIYVANLVSWIKTQFTNIINKLLDFLRYLMDKITEWFMQPNKQQQVSTNRLMVINSFPPGMQVPNVLNYEHLVTKLTSLRNLIVYIERWYNNLNDIFTFVKKDPANAAKIIYDSFKSYDSAVRAFTNEISHNHYRDGVVTSNDGCKVVVETASVDPVDPKEFGWNGGSQIRYTEALISTILKEITTLKSSISELYTNISNYSNQVITSNINNPVTMLLYITGYISNTAASLLNGIEEYRTKFYSMTEWIIQEIQKKK